MQFSARAARRGPTRRSVTAGVGLGAVVMTAAAMAQVAGASASPPPSGDARLQLAQASDGAGAGTSARRQRKIEQGGVVTAPSTAAHREDRTAFCAAAEGQRADGRGRRAATQDQQADRQRGASSFSALRVTTLGDSRDTRFTQPLGVNDDGVVVGRRGGDGRGRADRGFVAKPPYRSDDVRDAKVAGAARIRIAGINRAGVQVGSVESRDGRTSGFARLDKAFLTVRNPEGRARRGADRLLGINNRGVAAGFSTDARGRSRAFLFDTCSGAFTAIRVPVRADSVQATGINDAGTVSGTFTRGRTTQGFVLGRGRFTAIRIGNNTATIATGIDNAGDVVGTFVDKRGHRHGFVIARGRTRIIDVPKARDTEVTGVNDRGRLVGSFTTKDGRTVGFVATATK